jgi:hypothetical protein
MGINCLAENFLHHAYAICIVVYVQVYHGAVFSRRKPRLSRARQGTPNMSYFGLYDSDPFQRMRACVGILVQPFLEIYGQDCTKSL